MIRSVLLFAVALMTAALPASAEEPGAPHLDLSGLSSRWTPFLGVSAAASPTAVAAAVRPSIAAPVRDGVRISEAVSLLSGPVAGEGHWAVEGGYLRTSDDEKALYLGVAADWPVVSFGREAEGRLGVFIAYAEFPRLVEQADDLGVMTFGDFVPLVAAQATVRVGTNFSLVSRVGPSIDDGDMIVGFEAVYAF